MMFFGFSEYSGCSISLIFICAASLRASSMLLFTSCGAVIALGTAMLVAQVEASRITPTMISAVTAAMTSFRTIEMRSSCVRNRF